MNKRKPPKIGGFSSFGWDGWNRFYTIFIFI